MTEPAETESAGIDRIVPTADADLAARLRHRIDRKTKPVGALGRLEPLMLQLGLIQRTASPRLHAPQLLICAVTSGG